MYHVGHPTGESESPGYAAMTLAVPFHSRRLFPCEKDSNFSYEEVQEMEGDCLPSTHETSLAHILVVSWYLGSYDFGKSSTERSFSIVVTSCKQELI